jgi:hypothetical protein
MSILTYVKGLPTPASELNALGMTELEMFLEAFAGSSGYLVISQAYVTSGKGFSPYGENKVYPEIQFQPQTQKNPFAPIFRSAAIETVNHLLSGEAFNKSVWNTHLQQTFGINKRHANGVIAYAKGKVDSAKECRANHIKTLESKAKSIEAWSKSRQPWHRPHHR